MGVGRHAAEPGHLQRVEARVRIALDRKLRHAALEDRDRGAVLLGAGIDAIGQHQPGRLQVLHHQRRAARNMVAEVP